MKTDLTLTRPVTDVFDVPGTTVTGRDFRLLLEGIRSWYREAFCLPVAGRTGTAGEIPFPGCLGLLSGSPGSGKTLLVHALRQACDCVGIRFASSRCHRRVMDPLDPVLAVIETLLMKLSGEELRQVLGGLTPAMRAILIDLFPELSSSAVEPGLPPLPAELHRSRLVDLLAEVVGSFATHQPLVVVVEDAQWLDDISRDVLAACLRKVKYRYGQDRWPKILLVVTLTSEGILDSEDLDVLLDREFLAFDIKLRGYSREDLLDACGHTFQESVALSRRELVYQGTGGNPLVVRWVLDSLRAGDEPVDRRGIRKLKTRVGLEKLVQERYGQLGELERGIVDLLSHVVRPCSPSEIRLLSAALETPVGEQIGQLDLTELRTTCAALETAGWLVRELDTAGEWLWGIGGGGLARTLRTPARSGATREIHGRIGRLLFERASSSRRPRWSEVFYHLEKNAPSELLIRAGTEAIRTAEQRCAYSAAVELRGQILERLESLDSGLWRALSLEQAKLLESLDRKHEAIEVFQSLLAGKSEPLVAEERARYHRRLGRLYGELGDLPIRARMYLEGLSCLEGEGESLERIELQASLARLFLESGNTAESRRYLEECRDLVARTDLVEGEPPEIQRLAEEIAYHAGDYDEAVQIEERIAGRCSGCGDIRELLRSMEYLGRLHLLRGEPERARHFLERGLDLARQAGSRQLEARFHVQLGRLHRSRERLEKRLGHLSSGRDILLELGQEFSTRELHGLIAHLEFFQFRLDEGLENLRVYVEMDDPADRPPLAIPLFAAHYGSHEERAREVEAFERRIKEAGAGEGDLLWKLGDLLLDAGALEEAGKLYQRALKASDTLEEPVTLSLVLQKLGRWYRLRGEPAQALQFFEKALESLGSVPEKSVVGHAYLEVGDLLRVKGNLVLAYDYLLRALKISLELRSAQGEQRFLLALAHLLQDVGLRRACSGVARCAVELAEKSGELRSEAEACSLLGALASEAGDLEESQRRLARAGDLLERLDLPVHRAHLDLEVGWDRFRRKDFGAALQKARESLERARGIGLPTLRDAALHLLGVVESALDNPGKNYLRAVKVLRQALSGAREGQQVLQSRWILVSLARMYGERGKKDLAREYLHQEAELAHRLRAQVPREFRDVFVNEAVERVFRNEGNIVRTLREDLVD